MRKTLLVSLLSALLALTGASRAKADPVVIKLGTLAPQGSPWHSLLRSAAQDWQKTSNNQVDLKIFAGGTMGNEGDMVKKLRIGSLQAAALSTIGLHEIAKDPQALDIPLLVKNYEERNALLQDKEVMSKLEKSLEDKGFIVLTWSEIGFTRFFSTAPHPTLDSMRASKMFSWEGDPDSTNAWKAGGFKPTVLSSDAMLTALQTGMVESFLYPPTYVLALRGHDKAKYMHDMLWSTLTGATIVRKDVWEKIPADMRPQLKKIFSDYGAKIGESARKMEEDSISKMKQQGLTVVTISDPAAWQAAVQGVYKILRGTVVPADTFDLVFKKVAEYRAQHGGK